MSAALGFSGFPLATAAGLLLAAVLLLTLATTTATGHPFVCDGPTWPAFVVNGAWSCSPPGGLTA